MTITGLDIPADVRDIPADVELTPQDHLVGRGERGPDLAKHALPWSVHVGLHLRPETPITARLHESEQRVTVQFGGYCADVTVYLRRAQIDRLIAVLTAARRRLPEVF